MGDRPEDFGMSTLSGYCQFVTKAQFNPLIEINILLTPNLKVISSFTVVVSCYKLSVLDTALYPVFWWSFPSDSNEIVLVFIFGNNGLCLQQYSFVFLALFSQPKKQTKQAVKSIEKWWLGNWPGKLDTWVKIQSIFFFWLPCIVICPIVLTQFRFLVMPLFLCVNFYFFSRSSSLHLFFHSKSFASDASSFSSSLHVDKLCSIFTEWLIAHPPWCSSQVYDHMTRAR